MLELANYSPEKSEEEIIDYLINNAEYGSDNISCWAKLYYGSKRLEVFLIYPKKQMGTHLLSISDDRRQKTPNETTILYKAAAKIMQNWADCRNEQLGYNTSTQYKHLIEWCRTKANTVFNWELERTINSCQEFHTTFKPLSKDI